MYLHKGLHLKTGGSLTNHISAGVVYIRRTNSRVHGAHCELVQIVELSNVQHNSAITRRALLSAAACAVAAFFKVPHAKAETTARALMSAEAPQATFDTNMLTQTHRKGKIRRTEDVWRSLLSPERYATLRLAVTEAPFSSPLVKEGRVGTYQCAGCHAQIFSSITKFDAGTGWPSFYQSLPGAVTETNDFSAGMRRTEVRCSSCQSHFGHVFRDARAISGNQELLTNLRYCMNGNALEFVAT